MSHVQGTVTQVSPLLVTSEGATVGVPVLDVLGRVYFVGDRVLCEHVQGRLAVVAMLADTWHAPTFLNSWVNFGSPYRTAAYKRFPNGMVKLRGVVKNGTANTSIFTLPVGYRPAANEIFTNEIGRIDVQSSGTVIQIAGGNTDESLSNIFFDADQ